jgi:nicotinate-nucleotide adenylyltransferase
MARIGLYGGTFDPVHWGHLILAETAREALELDRVEFIVAAHPPHKPDAAISPAEHRLAMVRLAVADHSAFGVSDIELRRNGPSFSVDTVAEYHRRLDADDRLFFLIGSDTLADLADWRGPRRLAELATVAVAARPGFSLDDHSTLRESLTPEQVESMRRHTIPMPLIGLASRDLRARVAQRRSTRYMTPDAVRDYIRRHGLYGEESDVNGTR